MVNTQKLISIKFSISNTQTVNGNNNNNVKFVCRNRTDALAGNKKDVDLSMDTDAPSAPTHKPGGDPKIQHAVHEIRITNQQMYLFPSIEEARFQITQQLFAWEAIVTSQTRLQSSRLVFFTFIFFSIHFI